MGGGGHDNVIVSQYICVLREELKVDTCITFFTEFPFRKVCVESSILHLHIVAPVIVASLCLCTPLSILFLGIHAGASHIAGC